MAQFAALQRVSVQNGGGNNPVQLSNDSREPDIGNTGAPGLHPGVLRYPQIGGYLMGKRDLLYSRRIINEADRLGKVLEELLGDLAAHRGISGLKGKPDPAA